MKPMNLMFGCLGNGITVYDRNQTRSGDYLTVAHIDPCGAYKLYQPLPDDAKAQILHRAQTAAQAFCDTWHGMGQLRRMNELTEYVMTYRQTKAAGGYAALLNAPEEQTLALYIKYTCTNRGYTAPNDAKPF